MSMPNCCELDKSMSFAPRRVFAAQPSCFCPVKACTPCKASSREIPTIAGAKNRGKDQQKVHVFIYCNASSLPHLQEHMIPPRCALPSRLAGRQSPLLSQNGGVEAMTMGGRALQEVAAAALVVMAVHGRATGSGGRATTHSTCASASLDCAASPKESFATCCSAPASPEKLNSKPK